MRAAAVKATRAMSADAEMRAARAGKRRPAEPTPSPSPPAPAHAAPAATSHKKKAAPTPATDEAGTIPPGGAVACTIAYTVEEGGVPFFTPTWAQFKDFSKFIEAAQNVGAHYGLIKVKAPPEFRPNKAEYKNENLQDMKIQSPIRQQIAQVQGYAGAYQVLAMDEIGPAGSMSVREFESLSIATEAKRSAREQKLAAEADLDGLERKFWSQTLTAPALYGADSPGTLFDADCKEWNVGNLPSILHVMDGGVPGVSMPMLYWGQWKTSFAWHIEDVNLYSINYLHHGAPKQWYGIQPQHNAKFNRALTNIWPQLAQECREFIRHKQCLVSPSVLKGLGVPVIRTRQHRGEFIVPWPQGYHSGFNYGYNCAESVNFATHAWLAHTKPEQCSRCLCRGDTVWINPREVAERCRQLQFHHQNESKEDGGPKAKKQQPTIADVPSTYVIDAESIWLGLPTRPQDLRQLATKYLQPSAGGSSGGNGGRSMTGRSMAGRSMAPASSSASGSVSDIAASAVSSSDSGATSSDGFLFDEGGYNRMSTNGLEGGFSDDANAVHCAYADCTDTLHGSQQALMRHYASAHSASARAARLTAASAPPASSAVPTSLSASSAITSPTKRKANSVSTNTPAAATSAAAKKKPKLEGEHKSATRP